MTSEERIVDKMRKENIYPITIIIYVFNFDKCKYDIDHWNMSKSFDVPDISPWDYQWDHYFEATTINVSKYESLEMCDNYDYFPINKREYKHNKKFWGSPNHIKQEIFEIDDDFLFRDTTGKLYSWRGIQQKHEILDSSSKYFRVDPTNLESMMYKTMNRIAKLKQLNIE